MLKAIKTDLAQNINLVESNPLLEGMKPIQRVEWAFKNLPETHVVSSSFGAQSAVMLHLINEVAPGTPVILTDTGYLFPETYQFIDRLTSELSLNLHIYRAELSAAWQEARFGKQWEKGIEGIENYNKINKVEPMRRALAELEAGTWFAGLRRSQSDSREHLNVLTKQAGQFKVHPIIDQSNKQLHEYLKKNDLPYHPLWEKGYVSIGDWHTTQSLQEGMSEQDTRFFGMKRECGLHEFGDGDGI
ncbi:phosphoadenylyl-sulfate reductase [Glaciecola sp. KUL10]|uniref:phosphoadenylyl-sulfate reductase n=1 Tax=Glaciecola sp. (strain KUL10) TaxID=2161813 RepID=UPI000D7839FB|nr:phosphoadenylyl-sulfate reductase [Glaciecola sp. KUL10]GBL05997.1 phosphoadenosine phosphosulfate reductase [Glaciecola sp. KUL10]